MEQTHEPVPPQAVTHGSIAALCSLLAKDETLVVFITNDGSNDLLLTVQPAKNGEHERKPFQVLASAAEIDAQVTAAIAVYEPAVQYAVRTAKDVAATIKADADAKAKDRMKTAKVTPTNFKLTVNVTPANATIVVRHHADDTETPATNGTALTLPKGDHTITVSAENFQPHVERLTLTSDRTSAVSLKPTPQPALF